MTDWIETHLVLPTIAPCVTCGRDTRFVQGDFNAWMHPGWCTRQQWSLYKAACRGGVA